MATPHLNDVPSHFKDQLLAVLTHYMGQDLRQKLMLECPAAYNALCGRDIVEVHSVSCGAPIIPSVYHVTRVVFESEEVKS